jgi:hypothetical protein
MTLIQSAGNTRRHLNTMDFRRSLKSFARGVGGIALRLFVGPDPEIGPAEIAIFVIGGGIYMVAHALWPGGAVGCALVTAGALQLGCWLWLKGKALEEGKTR